MIYIFAVFTLLVTALLLFLPTYRDRKARFALFPHQWEIVINNNLPLYGYLPEPLKRQLYLLINSFVHRKKFYGCQGLEITDEIKITIAAQACLLLLNRQSDEFSNLKSVLVYPAAFIARREVVGDNGLHSMECSGLAGESWQQGKVILSWDDVKKGALDIHDGHNLVLHEFAHQLDGSCGGTNGAPALDTPNAYKTWARVMSREFEQLQFDAHHQLASLMSYYGATNPAEFFAVVTEVFFEKPAALKQKHPELYQLLATYYHIEPDIWLI